MSQPSINVQEELEALQKFMAQNGDKFNPHGVANFNIEDSPPPRTNRKRRGSFNSEDQYLHSGRRRYVVGGRVEDDSMQGALDNISALGANMGSLFGSPPRRMLPAIRYNPGQEEDMMAGTSVAASLLHANDFGKFVNRPRRDLVGRQPSWMMKGNNRGMAAVKKPLAANKHGIVQLVGKKTNTKPLVLGEPDDESPQISRQEAAQLMKEKEKADAAGHHPTDINNMAVEKDKQPAPNARRLSQSAGYRPVMPRDNKAVAIVEGIEREADCAEIRRALSRHGAISNFKCTRTCNALFAEVTFTESRALDSAVLRSPIRISHIGCRVFVLAKGEYTPEIDLSEGARVSIWTAEGRVAESIFAAYGEDGWYKGPCQVN